MTSNVWQADAINDRVDAAFHHIRMTIFKRTDRMFAYLMVGQWLFAILIAFLFSPYTWRGSIYTTHVHVYSAVFLGGAISSLPILLAIFKPGSVTTRHVIAVAQ